MICSAWIEGVSTRKVDDLVKALGNESGISRSTVSRICKDIDEGVHEFLARSLDHTWFPYLFVDATHLDVRVGHRRPPRPARHHHLTGRTPHQGT